MSVRVIVSWARARLDHWWNPLAATRIFFNSSTVRSAAMDSSEGVGIGPSRKLSDVSAGVSAGVSACGPPDDTSWMGRVNNVFLNEAYGSVILNMIADVLVRCMYIFLVPLLAFGYCRRAKSKDLKFTDKQLKQLSDMLEEREKALLHPDSTFCSVLEAAHHSSTRSTTRAGKGSTSGLGLQGSRNGLTQSNGDEDSTGSSASTSKAVKQIPKNGYPALTGLAYFEPTDDAEKILSILQMSPEVSSVLDDPASQSVLPATEVQKRPVKPDIRQRVNYLMKHLQSKDEDNIRGAGETATSSTSSTSSSTSTSGDEHIVDIPVLAVVPGVVPSPTSMNQGDILLRFFRVKLGIKIVDEMHSSRILQARVKSTEKNLKSLRDLAVEGMRIDQGFTLQIDRFYLYHCTGNPENPELLSLRDVEVPTILQAAYVAGVLTIRGRSLEGAEIRAATSKEYLILHSERQERSFACGIQREVYQGSQQNSNFLPLGNEIEEWRCTSPSLYSDKPIHIYASKEVCIEGQYFTVRSEASLMIDNTMRTVMREWVPATILTIFILYHICSLLTIVSSFTMELQLPWLWLLYLSLSLAIYILHNLPPRLEITIKSFVVRIKLVALSTLKIVRIAFSSSSVWKRNEHTSEVRDAVPKGNQSNTKIKASKSPIKPSRGNDVQIVDNLDWQWSSSRHRYSRTQNKWVTIIQDSEENQYEDSKPFEVIYRPFDVSSNLESGDSMVDNRPKNIVVRIFSKNLQNVLKVLLPRYFHKYENYADVQARHIFSLYQQGILVKVMAFYMDPIHVSATKLCEPNATWMHIFHLIRFIEQEYENTILQYQRMIFKGVISWDMLWTLIHENEKVVYYCDISKEELCGKVLSCHYSKQKLESSNVNGSESLNGCFEVDLEMWDYDCVSYKPKTIRRMIPEFFQETMISHLDVHPIKFEANVQEREAAFFNKGKRYHELVLKSERHYLQYKGIMFWSFPGSYALDKYVTHCRESVDGRVMIDQGAYSKMKSNRHMGTAQPAKGWLQGFLERDKNLPSESDENLQFSPTIVYGFSFSLKKWGCFLIPGLHEITFNPSAFNTLVMKEEQSKRMLLAMTEYYLKRPMLGSETKSKDVAVDPLPHKGKGCIILLHGPPGTGKTFTVEALAEKMECPLWQLTVSTLKIKPKQLETKIVKKFEVAALWGAILLLDEADVYLSSRKYSPLATDANQGNALTSVFLRILEYYKGILFLTTNQIDSFEPAIDSRISLSLKYKEFNVDQRRQLWSSFLERVGISSASSAFWKEVLSIQLNGRVIRNIVSNAHILCVSQGEQLHENHVLYAFQVMLHTTSRGLTSSEEKLDSRDGGSRDGGQDSVSIPPSFVAQEEEE